MPAAKYNRWLSVITIILLVANVVTLALLWTNNHKDNGGEMSRQAPGRAFEFLTKELQLNEQQQNAYRELRDQHQSAQRALQDSLRQSKDALFSLLSQKDVPDSVLQDYSNRSNSFEQRLDIVTFRHFQQVRALCNGSQQQKFDHIIQDVLRRMGPPKRGEGPPPDRDGFPPPPRP